MNKVLLLNIFLILIANSCQKNDETAIEDEILYRMPEESEPHEGTWLQWPHHYQYGTAYRNEIDPTWIAMTEALVTSEKVHIIAYNDAEKTRIIQLLNNILFLNLFAYTMSNSQKKNLWNKLQDDIVDLSE